MWAVRSVDHQAKACWARRAAVIAHASQGRGASWQAAKSPCRQAYPLRRAPASIGTKPWCALAYGGVGREPHHKKGGSPTKAKAPFKATVSAALARRRASTQDRACRLFRFVGTASNPARRRAPNHGPTSSKGATERFSRQGRRPRNEFDPGRPQEADGKGPQLPTTKLVGLPSFGYGQDTNRRFSPQQHKPVPARYGPTVLRFRSFLRSCTSSSSALLVGWPQFRFGTIGRSRDGGLMTHDFFNFKPRSNQRAETVITISLSFSSSKTDPRTPQKGQERRRLYLRIRLPSSRHSTQSPKAPTTSDPTLASIQRPFRRPAQTRTARGSQRPTPWGTKRRPSATTTRATAGSAHAAAAAPPRFFGPSVAPAGGDRTTSRRRRLPPSAGPARPRRRRRCPPRPPARPRPLLRAAWPRFPTRF